MPNLPFSSLEDCKTADLNLSAILNLVSSGYHLNILLGIYTQPLNCCLDLHFNQHHGKTF